MSGPTRDEFQRLRTSYLRLRTALRDPTTDFYAVSLYFDEIRALLSLSARVGVIWLSLGDRRLVESIYGWEAYDRLIARAAGYLRRCRGLLLPEGSIVTIAGVHSDAFAIFVPREAAGREISAEGLAVLSATLREGLEDELSAPEAPNAPISAAVHVGAALLADQPFHRFERCVYRALDEARSVADSPHESERLTWLSEFQRLLRDQDIKAVFQPVVELETGKTVAIEAYSRGPQNSVLSMPRVLFSVGRVAGLVGVLDRLCRRQAIDSLRDASFKPLVFLNTTAESLLDPDWLSETTLRGLEAAGLTPANVVLDVSEGEIGPDPSQYRDALSSLTEAGYRLSIDDLGSSSRSAAIVEKLRPAFLKFDLTLVRGIERDQLRRELVRSLVDLAERAGAQLVAERVETAAERQSLIDCGARWGQGYLFGSETSEVETPGEGREAKP